MLSKSRFDLPKNALKGQYTLHPQYTVLGTGKSDVVSLSTSMFSIVPQQTVLDQNHVDTWIEDMLIAHGL